MAENAPLGYYYTGAAPARPKGVPVEDDLERRAISANKPLIVEHIDSTNPHYGTWPVKLEIPVEKQEEHFKDDPGLTIKIGSILLSLIVPPLAFGYVTYLHNFWPHFKYPRLVWFFVALVLVPIVITVKTMNRAFARGLPIGWHKHIAVMLIVAAVSAGIAGDLNYWHFMKKFYHLRTMKDYDNIDPSETKGAQMMDAAKVNFMPGARLATDLAAAYTSWDVYCVAPITTNAGMPSQGTMLNDYDFWAVGVNCCQSGGFAYNCGAIMDPTAHGGIRLIDAEQIPFFNLAVQQAEAAYGFRSANPTFFYWVKDPELEQNLLFEGGFQNVIFACSAFFIFNAGMVIVRIMAFHQPPKMSSMLGDDQH